MDKSKTDVTGDSTIQQTRRPRSLGVKAKARGKRRSLKAISSGGKTITRVEATSSSDCKASRGTAPNRQAQTRKDVTCYRHWNSPLVFTYYFAPFSIAATYESAFDLLAITRPS
jgi:hypothetical protein